MAAENNLDVLDAENQEIISNDLPNTEPTVVYEKKVDDLGRAYATGKRKNAVARDWIKPVSYTHLTLPTNREV